MIVAMICVVLTVSASAETQLPLQQEKAEIKAARDRALAACDALSQERYDQLGTVIADGQITDRDGLIAMLEYTERPEAEMASMADKDLINTALMWAMTLHEGRTCHAEAYRQATEAYQELSKTLRERTAALRAETASLQDLRAVLEQLETLADDDDAILRQIEELRQATAESRQSTAQLKARTECIINNVTTGNTEPDCSDPTVFGEFLER